MYFQHTRCTYGEGVLVETSCYRLLFLSALVLPATTACDSGGNIFALVKVPVRLRAVSFIPNPLMVTAAVAHVECSGSIAALQISYTALDVDSASTPRLPVSSCPSDISVLGLVASTSYNTRIVAWGRGGDSASVSGPALVTDSLPSSLPQVTTEALGNAPVGLTAFTVLRIGSTAGNALIVDSIGRVRWYVTDSNRFMVDLQPQPNGRLALALGVPDSLSPNPSTPYFDYEYDELDIPGNLLRRWLTATYSTDPHDFRLTSQRTGVLLGLDYRTMDLSAYGGSSTAQVAGNVLQEVDTAGQVLFQWNAFDHFSITDVDPSISLTSSFVDWTHGNAIEIDQDGNYLVSFRHFSEITKIHSRTGQVVWRLGGLRNEFQFIRDSLMFSFQHGIRRLANGNYILFDNGNTHNPPFSRAVEYSLDQSAKTATLVWSYRPNPDIFSFALGFAQRLADGNTLTTFGVLGTVHEVTPLGQLAWKLTLPPGDWIYRAYRIRSLYEPYLVDESPTPTARARVRDR